MTNTIPVYAGPILPFLLIFFVSVVMLSCTPVPDRIPEEIPPGANTPVPAEPQINCVLTADVFRATCQVDLSNEALLPYRYDTPSRNKLTMCEIVAKGTADPAAPYLWTENVPLTYGAATLPLHDKNFDEWKNLALHLYSSDETQLDMRELPTLGKVFMTYRPSIEQYNRAVPLGRLEEQPVLKIMGEKEGIIYNLEFPRQGELIHYENGERVVEREVELCSPEEGIELMAIMLEQMASSGQRNQPYSGCALTPEIIHEECDINPPSQVQLESFLFNNDCKITASTVRSDNFLVANFKELGGTFADAVGSGGMPLSNIGDEAVLKEGPRGVSIYFRAGDKVGVFSTYVDEELQQTVISDPDGGNLAVGGSCNEQEAQNIVKNILVPFLERS